MAKEDVVSHCNMPLYVVHDINHNTKKDPVGFLATKAFLCFPFIWLQETDFIQPPCPPLNTIDRFNQLLIRQEEIGYKGGTFKKMIVQPWEMPWFPIKGLIQHLWAILQWNSSTLFYTETHTRWEKLTVCCPQAHRYQIGWNQKVYDADSHLPHQQPVRRMCMSWLGPLWMIAVKLLTTPSRLWKLFSHFQLFVTPWTIESMEFSRSEYWSR